MELTPLRTADGPSLIDGANLSWNFVGFIPVKKNTPQAEAVQIRAAPCEIPDPLLEDRTRDIPAGITQPVWITVRVPASASPRPLSRPGCCHRPGTGGPRSPWS